MLLITLGCQTVPPEPVEQAPPPVPEKPRLPSAEPITATNSDAVFAQTALKSLGYKVGYVDGIWGPRSAAAMRKFEQDNQLASAAGRLSELNLYSLEQVTRYQRTSFTALKPNQRGIKAKLNKAVPLSAGAQLIIIEKPYPILARPNPYSEVVATVPAGTGIYVISLQEGWYKVESTERHSGYIRAD